MLRISIAGQLSEIQLKRTVKPNLWNQNKERCTGKDAASVEINRYLESVKLRLFEIHRKMEEDGKLINPMEIKRKFLGLDEEHKMFFQVFQEHNDKCRELIGKDYAKVTISRFDTCLKYFREMSLAQYQRKDIPLKEMKEKRIISAFNSELKLKGFKAFQIDDDSKETRTYSRKEFYKICLTTGKSIIHYADKSFEQEGTILFFGSTIPYSTTSSKSTPEQTRNLYAKQWFEFINYRFEYC